MFMNKSMAGKTIPKTANTQKYRTKYKKIKKYMLFIIYENAALCDQITYLQEKILYTKEENNFLTRKLKHLEFLKNASGCDINNVDTTTMTTVKKVPTKRKIQISPGQDTDLPKQMLKVKKPVKNARKKQTPTVSKDARGQLILPINLNDLTRHSLAEQRINLQDDVLMKDDVEACISYSALVKGLPQSFNRDPFRSPWLPG